VTRRGDVSSHALASGRRGLAVCPLSPQVDPIGYVPGGRDGIACSRSRNDPSLGGSTERVQEAGWLAGHSRKPQLSGACARHAAVEDHSGGKPGPFGSVDQGKSQGRPLSAGR
jgi:hypothetical protein